MIYTLVPKYNGSIKEKEPTRNTGLDEVLELRKEKSGSAEDLLETRIILKFPTSELRAAVTASGQDYNNLVYKLKLFSLQESELPFTFNITAHPISSSWQNGSGRFLGNIVTDGASWNTVAGSGSANWSSGSSGDAVNFEYLTTPGGGDWYSSSVASASFEFDYNDYLEIDVSDIIKSYLTGSIDNQGILLRLAHNEISSSTYPTARLQFYSSNTKTVYSPQLQLFWTSSTYITGSEITYSDYPIVYTVGNRHIYRKDTKVRINLGCRPRYPRPSFGQNTTFSTSKLLPTGSYFQIIDAHTNEILIPYSDYTKLSSNGTSSYFDFWSTMLYPERFYRFELKSEFTETTEYFSSNEFIFKIVR